MKKNEVTKVSALFESAEAISVLIGPIGGAFIYSFFGLPGVILVDVITCLFGIATITFFKSKEVEVKGKLSFRNISKSNSKKMETLIRLVSYWYG